jgi:hypothetical protein
MKQHKKLCIKSIYITLRHCEKRSSLKSTDNQSQRQTENRQAGTKSCEATKQSPFTNQVTRDFHNIYKIHSTPKSEQGDCFRDAATMSGVVVQNTFN